MGRLEELFRVKKPVIGTVPLVGHNIEERKENALEVARIYEKEGVSGILIENSHGGTLHDIYEVVAEISKAGLGSIAVGTNLLKNPRMALLTSGKYGSKFAGAGSVQRSAFASRFNVHKQFTLGNFDFQFRPWDGCLGYYLKKGMGRCDAIVSTEEETLSDLVEYKEMMGDFPLLIEKGFDFGNVYEQLKVVDGAIAKDWVKLERNHQITIDEYRIREVMDAAKLARK